MEDRNVEVSDLGLASLLATLQFELVGLERVNTKRINFVFKYADGIQRVIDDFWADAKVTVQAQSLFHTQKTLKNRLYALK